MAASLDRVARRECFDLVFAHVNAGLRDSAWQDEGVVLSVASRLGRVVRVAAPAPGRDDEATLRTERYAALAKIAAEHGAWAIATAHTAADQTETVLLALFRGTGLAGLAGMAPVSELPGGLQLLRPLLRVTHADLLDELYRSGLPYALDPTNRERRYRRNAVRAALVELRLTFRSSIGRSPAARRSCATSLRGVSASPRGAAAGPAGRARGVAGHSVRAHRGRARCAAGAPGLP